MNERRDSSSFRGVLYHALMRRPSLLKGIAGFTGRSSRRSRTACTSLLVMHRDPFDVGLSAVREPMGGAATIDMVLC
ncbi:hypothetical protein RR46_00560 [Papilio xuthus]|uniref:Uncharacterized protein n=1 Tax=Papilio xuthus TaxID=66420 RepID=A0A0N0PFF5_PAPXU|nr:hypothetical protein RR46_00560 [Papilio xuthus]